MPMPMVVLGRGKGGGGVGVRRGFKNLRLRTNTPKQPLSYALFIRILVVRLDLETPVLSLKTGQCRDERATG